MKFLKSKFSLYAILGTLCFFLGVAWAADSKLSALTELTVGPARADELYINDGGTSKKITAGTLFQNYGDTVQTVTSTTGEIQLDVSGGNAFFHTLDENLSIIDIQNSRDAQITPIYIFFTQDATTPRTWNTTDIEIDNVNLGTNACLWPAGVEVEFSTGTSDVDMMIIYLDRVSTTERAICAVGGQNLS